ncbi:quinone oxidoreductase family protein [Pleomorphomonas carboxyditropha]|uniref:Quinone oxidoreductase n=1 Tax=Pleomorphomonas carboxyditropha TaxID=2023338 RepID=A0A2G9WPT7_9HYPH|nr:quinone oxidoreductase [Pleomorphomonas carboxyditropha]PIO96693.1 quinone oxidoreductase [Pleomorphomonas carboxyditropha]
MSKAMLLGAPGGPEALSWEEVADRAPAAGEAAVRHTAVGVNFIDTYYRSGLYAWPEAPLVVGAEAAGVVESVGPGVEGLKAGDRVAYTTPLGAYRERRLIAADRLVRLPDGISDEIAATVMLKGLTVQYLVTSTFPVKAGDVALVHAAAGGVGLLMGQWLKALGATTIGTVGSPEKAELARAHGYDHVIDYRRDDFVATALGITDGRGCDVVYDSVGRDTWTGSLKSLRKRGAFVSFGQSSGPIEGFSLSMLAQGGSLSASRPMLFHFIEERAELEARAADLFGRLASGAVTAEVRQRFALSAAAEAHRALEGRATTGASVLTV